MFSNCVKFLADMVNRHTRSELRPGNPRPSNRTWYYINYRHTIDAIKWRVYTIDKEVQGTPIVANEKKEYFCSFCKAEWTIMEALDSVGPGGFLCHRCNRILTYEADRNAGGHEQSTRLNDQFKFISELLPKIDAAHIQECDFDRALSKARPVIRDATHQRIATIAADDGANRPMAVRGLTNTGPQSIAVNISTSDGPSAAEKEAEKARRDKVAQQNALPAWMSNSTITGDSFAGAASNGAGGVKGDEASRDLSKGKLANNNASAQIDDIFERLKAEQAANLARGADDEDEEEEYESEDEFEDVPATENPSALGTPAVGREASGEVSGVQSRSGDSSDERVAKKARIESDIKKVEGTGAEEEDEEDDDELEFEDV